MACPGLQPPVGAVLPGHAHPVDGVALQHAHVHAAVAVAEDRDGDDIGLKLQGGLLSDRCALLQIPP